MPHFCDIPYISFLRRFALTLLTLLSLALAGCSVLYSYNTIDRYIRWSLDDYIDWSDQQDRQLRERLHAQLQWHRVTQLPGYREWLEARLIEINGNVSVAQWRIAADQLQVFWREALIHTTDDICAQLSQLSDEQVQDLLVAMHEKQKDLAEKFADETAAEANERRRNKMEKMIRYWIGSLNKTQSDLIATWAHSLPDTRQQRLEGRQRWINAFAQALTQRHNSAVFAPKIQQLFASPQDNWGEEYRAIWQRRVDANIELFAALHNQNSAEQRQFERERIEHWLKIIDNLVVD